MAVPVAVPVAVAGGGRQQAGSDTFHLLHATFNFNASAGGGGRRRNLSHATCNF